MNYLIQMIIERRMEILMFDFAMHLGIFLFTITLTALYVVAVITGKPEIYRLGAILTLGLLAFVATRGDFLIHRAAGYIRYTEKTLTSQEAQYPKPEIKTWEEWKSERKNGWVLVMLDAIGMLVIIYLLYHFQTYLWSSGEYVFVTVTTAAILGVIALFAMITKLAPQ